jgi:D-glycero-D-manno-heptose 1,7-bisphosphate phosphatase
VELMPGAAAAVARLNRAGLPVVLVTNQSGIGRGLFGEAGFQAVQERLADLLAAGGARLDAVYHCPHAPDHVPPCDCRKPAPGLFLRAAREHGLDLASSFYAGDRLRDVAPAAELGGTGILVTAGARGEDREPPPEGVLVVRTLGEAVERIVETSGAKRASQGAAAGEQP